MIFWTNCYQKKIQAKHLDSFKATVPVFDRHASLKEKHVICKQAAFANKKLNKFKQDRTISSHAAYKKQRNICGKLLRKTKKYFFNNLDVKCVTDNKPYWKTVKLCLTNKKSKDGRTKLIESEKIATNKREVVKIFNEYFSSVVSNFKHI